MDYDRELKSHGGTMALAAENHEAAAAAAHQDAENEGKKWGDGAPPDHVMQKHREAIAHHTTEAKIKKRRADYALRDPGVHLMGPDEVSDHEYLGKFTNLIAESYARGRTKGGVESLRQ
jgi:hypothetical protein